MRIVELDKNRLEALSDGVMAIAITLLVVEIIGFESVATTDEEFLRMLARLWPHFLSFGLSFLFIGIYWLIHHLMFHYIRACTRRFILFNLAFLMGVTFIPFPTDLLADHLRHELELVIVFYAAVHLYTGSVLIAMWRVATKDHLLVDPDLSDETVRFVYGTAIIGPVASLLALAAAFFSIRLSLLILLATPVLFLLPVVTSRWPTPTAAK